MGYMGSRRSHLLQPLATLMSDNAQIDRHCKIAFDEIKLIVACNTLLAYPYFSKLFGIYINYINWQL